jgi:hypothetical protein
MVRFDKLLIVTALAGFVILGSANRARADLELILSVDNADLAHSVVIDIPANTGPAIFNGNLGTGLSGAGSTFNVFLSVGTSNSPGTPAQALAQQGSFSIQNLDNLNGHTLHISVSAQGFTAPQSPPPLDVLDAFSGTLANGSIGGDFYGTADATNALFGTGFDQPGLHGTYSASGLSQKVGFNGRVSGFSPNGNTYSLSVFADMNFGAGSLFTGDAANVQTVPTPAPAGVVLALTGLPCVGLGAWLRRRKLA